MSSTLTQILAARPLTGAQLAAADALLVLDSSASGASKDAAATLSSLRDALVAYNAQSNSSGNTTVSPGVLAAMHTEAITFTGSAGTRVVILDTATSPADGTVARLRLNLPATASIVVEVRNATSGGTLLASVETDGSGSDAFLSFTYTGSAWSLDFATYPTA